MTAEARIEELLEKNSAVLLRSNRHSVYRLAKGRRVPKGTRFHQVYGISMDEAGRAVRIRARLKDKPWIVPVFPLL